MLVAQCDPIRDQRHKETALQSILYQFFTQIMICICRERQLLPNLCSVPVIALRNARRLPSLELPDPIQVVLRKGALHCLCLWQHKDDHEETHGLGTARKPLPQRPHAMKDSR